LSSSGERRGSVAIDSEHGLESRLAKPARLREIQLLARRRKQRFRRHTIATGWNELEDFFDCRNRAKQQRLRSMPCRIVELTCVDGHRAGRGIGNGKKLSGIDELRPSGPAEPFSRWNLGIELKLELPQPGTAATTALVHCDQSFVPRFESMLRDRSPGAALTRMQLDIQMTLETRPRDQHGAPDRLARNDAAGATTLESAPSSTTNKLAGRSLVIWSAVFMRVTPLQTATLAAY
jgi:hypothetical protein